MSAATSLESAAKDRYSGVPSLVVMAWIAGRLHSEREKSSLPVAGRGGSGSSAPHRQQTVQHRGRHQTDLKDTLTPAPDPISAAAAILVRGYLAHNHYTSLSTPHICLFCKVCPGTPCIVWGWPEKEFRKSG